MTSLLQDLRYGVRMLAKNPGITALAVLSIALGVGANTTIFSMFNTILLRPLPIADPESVVSLQGSVSYPDYLDYRDRNGVFSALAVYSHDGFGIQGDGPPAVALGSLASDGFFEAAGVEPYLGRFFGREENQNPGADPVVVISHACWRNRFGSDPHIIGREALVSGYPFTVIGVAPESFTGLPIGLPAELWVPVMMQPQVTGSGNSFQRRGTRYLRMIGRLKPGVSIDQAQANMQAISAQLAEEFPDNNRRNTVSLVPVNSNRTLVDDSVVKGFFVILLGVVGLVLLIACLNVASLLLARVNARRQEIALRLSLGAERSRIVRQMLTESLLLAGLAGVAGAGLAYWLTHALAAYELPLPAPVTIDFPLDWRVLAFTLGVTLLTGVVFGMAPAAQALRPRLFESLKSTRALGAGRGVGRFQNGLVVAQIAVSLCLLIAAALAIQSLRYAGRMDVGFNPDNSFAMSIEPTFAQYDEPAGRRLFDDMVATVERIPGVAAVGLTTAIPLGVRRSSSRIQPEGYAFSPSEPTSLLNSLVSEGYFEAMGIPLIEGRVFLRSDDQESKPVLIINEAFAKRFWPGQSAIGKFAEAGGARREIVGVVKTGKYGRLNEEPRPVYYYPIRQRYGSNVEMVVRTSGVDAAAVVPKALNEVQRLESRLPIYDVKTLHKHLGFALLPSRVMGLVVGGFGGLALLLALVGVYGVTAYSVSQRTHEFGIRSALGGRKRDILGLVVRRGLWITLVGAAVGLAGSLALARVLEGFLLGVDALDPLTFVLVPLALVAAALGACYTPAANAARVDPMTALRYE